MLILIENTNQIFAKNLYFLVHSWYGKKRVNIASKSVLYQRFCVYVKKSNTLLINFIQNH